MISHLIIVKSSLSTDKSERGEGVIPKIGEVDEEGVARLLVQTQASSPVFDRLGLYQITCTEGVGKLEKTGDRVLY